MAAAGSTASDGEAPTEGKYAAGRRKSTTTRSPSARMPTPSGPLRPARRSLAPPTPARSEASGAGRAARGGRAQGGGGGGGGAVVALHGGVPVGGCKADDAGIDVTTGGRRGRPAPPRGGRGGGGGAGGAAPRGGRG